MLTAAPSAEQTTPIAELSAQMTGRVVTPSDPDYDAVRQVFNLTADLHPAAVALPRDASDVIAAVDYARANGLRVAPQATGHNGAAFGSLDDALLVDVRELQEISIDIAARRVRVGAGVKWERVVPQLSEHGLGALHGSSPDVGVTGYTLGGGLGWLARRHGLAADSVLRARVVTANGDLITADPDRHADLFWALRGGGGSFGVVTDLEFRLYPVSRVYAGAVTFGRERAAETLTCYRRWSEQVPDEMSTAILLGRDGTLTVKAMYAGDPADGRRLLEPLFAVAGAARSDTMRVVDYARAAMGGTPARTFDQVRTLDDGLLSALVDEPGTTVEIRHWGGRIARDTGAAAHRDAPFSVILDAAPSARVTAALGGSGIGSSFLNFLSDPSRVATAFTPANWAALCRVKAAYDPDAFFGAGLTIPPAAARVSA